MIWKKENIMSPSEYLKGLSEGKSGKAVPCPQAAVMWLGELRHGARSLGVRVTSQDWEGSAEGRWRIWTLVSASTGPASASSASPSLISHWPYGGLTVL